MAEFPGRGSWLHCGQGGTCAVFLGFPIGLMVLAGVVMQAWVTHAGASPSLMGGRFLSGVIVAGLVLVPYTVAGGAITALYRREMRIEYCCGLLAAGAAAAFILSAVAVGRAASWGVSSHVWTSASTAGVVLGGVVLATLGVISMLGIRRWVTKT